MSRAETLAAVLAEHHAVHGGIPPVNQRRLVRALDAALTAQERERGDAWDEGYEAGRADEGFDARGLSTDADAAEHPHSNPYPTALAWHCDGCGAQTTGKCAAEANPEDCSARRRWGPLTAQEGERGGAVQEALDEVEEGLRIVVRYPRASALPSPAARPGQWEGYKSGVSEAQRIVREVRDRTTGQAT